jgi:hypothetical protein
VQALAAHCYQIGVTDFAHILGTFPLVPQPYRDAALGELVRLQRL